MEPKRYMSRPTVVWASEPLTPDNVDDLWKWVSTNGGWAQILPTGYEFGLYIQVVSGTKVPVHFGYRVLFNPLASKPDFWPIEPVIFNEKYLEAEDDESFAFHDPTND